MANIDNKTISEMASAFAGASQFVKNTNNHSTRDLNLGLSADGGVHVITQTDPEIAESISEDLCLLEAEDIQFCGYHVGKIRLFPMRIADRFATTQAGLNEIYTAEEKARKDMGTMLKQLPEWGKQLGEMVDSIENRQADSSITRRKAEWTADEEELRHKIKMAQLEKELKAITEPTTDFEKVD